MKKFIIIAASLIFSILIAGVVLHAVLAPIREKRDAKIQESIEQETAEAKVRFENEVSAWKRYEKQTYGFAVSFPIEPEYTSYGDGNIGSGAAVHLFQATVDNDSVDYFVMKMQLAPNVFPSDADIGLEKTLNLVVSSYGGSVNTYSFAEKDGRRYLDAVITVPQDNYVAEMKSRLIYVPEARSVFVIGNLYERYKAPMGGLYAYFLDSFEIF